MLHRLEDVVVGVPAVSAGVVRVFVLPADVGVEEGGDPRDAGFDESAGEEAGLAGAVTAVALAKGSGFACEVECGTGLGGFEDVEGFAGLSVAISERGIAIGVELCEERFALGEAFGREIGVELETTGEELIVGGIADHVGVERAAEKARLQAGSDFFGDEQRAVDLNSRIREAGGGAHSLDDGADVREVGRFRIRV